MKVGDMVTFKSIEEIDALKIEGVYGGLSRDTVLRYVGKTYEILQVDDDWCKLHKSIYNWRRHLFKTKTMWI